MASLNSVVYANFDGAFVTQLKVLLRDLIDWKKCKIIA